MCMYMNVLVKIDPIYTSKPKIKLYDVWMQN